MSNHSRLDFEIAIIGGGPAGMTAAIYASRAMRKTVIIEKLMPGGMVAITDNVENYPGFPEGVNGYELSSLMQKQAERFGTEILSEEVVAIKDNGKFKTIKTTSGEHTSAAVIICTGESYRKLAIPGESEHIGSGVSFCATCDGAFYKDKEVVVIGGGDTAIEEGMFLTRFAKRVRIIHRRDQLRAIKLLQERAFENPKIELVWDSIPLEILGETKVTGIRLKNVKTEQETELSTDGVFVFIGYIPNSQCIENIVDLDDTNHVLTNEKMETSVEGIFAAGDVRLKSLRQITTCVGEGSVAGFFADRYIEETLGS